MAIKPKPKSELCIVQIGYEKYALPFEAATAVMHGLMGAYKLSSEYISPKQFAYLSDNCDVTLSTLGSEPIDAVGVAYDDLRAYWEALKAAIALSPDAANTFPPVKAWIEQRTGA